MKVKQIKNQERKGDKQMKQEQIRLGYKSQLNEFKLIKSNEHGVTLVALVVTIIIMLILAGVVLNLTLGDNGIINKAKRAVEEYDQSEQEEKEALDNLEKEMDKALINPNDYIGAFVTGYEPDEKTYTISASTSGVPEKNYGTNGIKENGDQEFTTDPNMQWRIWDYDGTTITIISSKSTTTSLYLSDAAGYNNGVYAINEIARQCYTQQGLKDITVRNLRRTDIQKISTYDYTNYKHKEEEYVETDETTGNLIYFGETKTYDENHTSPAMWKTFDSQWDYNYSSGAKTGDDKECDIWEEEHGYTQENGTDAGDASTEFKQSYYYHQYNESEFKNSQYYDMIFKDGEGKSIEKNYWLAGRDVHLYSSYCGFGLHYVYAHSKKPFICADGVYYSSDTTKTPEYALRPFVSINLKSNNLELVEKSGDTKSYEIKSKTE